MCVNSSSSDWESVICGVPQDSILRPLLFIFYINDLPTDIISKLLLFADDIKLIKMLLSIMSHSELQNDLVMVRKMAVKIQNVEIQSALFWTDRYQTLYDVEY